MPATMTSPAAPRRAAGSRLHDVQSPSQPAAESGGGQSFPHNPGAKPGDTMEHNGHTYMLTGSPARWHRQDQQPSGAPGGAKAQSGAMAGKAPAQGDMNASKADNPAFRDHAQRHDATRQALGQIQGPARGIMAAMHANPDVREGKSYTTMDFAPEQTGDLHQWLSQNAGQEAGGGKVLDLGNGRYGFSSPAGAVVVWPADASGRHKVSYTNQTGVVAEGMQNPQPPGEPMPTEPGEPPIQQRGQRPGQQQPSELDGTTQNTPADEDAFAPSRATPEQMAAAGVLGEKPGPKRREGGPRTAREMADDIKQQIHDATQRWNDELKGGLSTKGNARWRSYLAALGSQYAHQDKLARAEERDAKAAAKQAAAKKSGGGQAGSATGGDDLDEWEKAAAQNAGPAFEELRGMREGVGEEAYRDMVQQLAGQRKPWERVDLGRPEDRPEDRPKDRPGAQRNLLGVNNRGNPKWIPPKGTFKNSAKTGESAESPEQGAMNRLGIQPRTAADRQADQSRREQRDADLAAGKHLEQPPSKSEVEARMRAEAAKGFTIPAPKQPPPLEGTDAWKSLVKKKAAEWDMAPHDFHELASDLHKELENHQGEQKAAYLAARKMTGLTPADINKLENEGFDSGSVHPKIKQLDTIGRELAAQYPGLGWGRGREDEHENDVDYAEKLWHLIRSGYKPPPGKHSPEFMEHVEDFLRSQLKSAGSSGGSSGGPGAIAEGEDLSAVPFSRVRRGVVQRYRKWLCGELVAI